MPLAPRLTPSEQRGMFVLIIVLLALCLVVWWRAKHCNTEPVACVSLDSVSNAFLDSMDNRTPAVRTTEKAERFSFDPNTADSATFVKLGLPSWIAARVLHYRAAGGVFHKTEDFKKIYGMKTDDYENLKNYIVIAQRFQVKPKNIRRDILTTVKETYHAEHSKYESGVQLDLNSADSAQLTRIPGIGPYFAHRIVSYRKRLGGYATVGQLREIKNFPDDVAPWFVIGTAPSKSVFLNRQDFRSLLRHPYLNFEQVKVIMNYREKFGNIHTFQELSNSEAFTNEDFERLAPYVSFE